MKKHLIRDKLVGKIPPSTPAESLVANPEVLPQSGADFRRKRTREVSRLVELVSGPLA